MQRYNRGKATAEAICSHHDNSDHWAIEGIIGNLLSKIYIHGNLITAISLWLSIVAWEGETDKKSILLVSDKRPTTVLYVNLTSEIKHTVT